MDYVINGDEMRWGNFRGGRGFQVYPQIGRSALRPGCPSAGVLERLGGGLLVYVIADRPCG